MTEQGGSEEAPGAPVPVYLPPWRIDVTAREDVPELLPRISLARSLRSALLAAGAPRPASIGLILTNDAELAELNATHMGKEGPTDVLSFPLLPPEAFPIPEGSPFVYQPDRTARSTAAALAFALPPAVRLHLGDVVVSVERAIEQAEHGRGGQTGHVRWSPAEELRLLAIHGTLHICGWDHEDPDDEAAMRDFERRLLATP